MDTCPRCGQRAARLSLVPSSVFTKELLTVGGSTEVEVCSDCIEELMRGDATG